MKLVKTIIGLLLLSLFMAAGFGAVGSKDFFEAWFFSVLILVNYMMVGSVFIWIFNLLVGKNDNAYRNNEK